MLERLKTGSDMEKILQKSEEALDSGDLIVYPTDTVYGLGADATSDEAVKKVYEAKSRSEENPISVIVDSLSMAERVASLDANEKRVIRKMFPGPLTIVSDSNSYVSDRLTGNTGKIGIRIPDHALVIDLVSRLGRPMTTTSANITGGKTSRSPEEAIDQVGDSVEIVIDDGELEESDPSTVFEIEDSNVKIIREGPISKSTIRKVL